MSYCDFKVDLFRCRMTEVFKGFGSGCGICDKGDPTG
jgi:hypothetical protein